MSPLVGSRRPTGDRHPRHDAGLSLVELLVALSITAAALGAAWPLLWNASGAADDIAARSQARSSGAAAIRRIASDLRLAAALQPLPAGVRPGRGLSMAQYAPDGKAETVLIAWDETRRVLWRNAPGTYLSDRVESLALVLVDADGREVAAESLQSAESCRTVALVRVTMVASYGEQRWICSANLPVGPR